MVFPSLSSPASRYLELTGIKRIKAWPSVKPQDELIGRQLEGCPGTSAPSRVAFAAVARNLEGQSLWVTQKSLGQQLSRGQMGSQLGSGSRVHLQLGVAPGVMV